MKSEPGDICRIFIIFAGMKNRGAYQDASRFSFYCKVPFLVQEMETVRVVEVISELERICCRSISGIPGFPTRFIGNFPCRRITSCGNISACAGRSASIIGKKSMYSHVP